MADEKKPSVSNKEAQENTTNQHLTTTEPPTNPIPVWPMTTISPTPKEQTNNINTLVTEPHLSWTPLLAELTHPLDSYAWLTQDLEQCLASWKVVIDKQTQKFPYNSDTTYGHLNIDLQCLQECLSYFSTSKWINNKFKELEVNDNEPQCGQVFISNDPVNDILFQATNMMFANFDLVTREIWGDGNCGFYVLLLGLALYGKVPQAVFKSDTNLAAAMLSLWHQATDYLGGK